MTEAQRENTGIAIIGMAGRFPGASSVNQYWQNLIRGVESIHFASPEELCAAGVDPSLIASPNYVPASSTVEKPEWFDAGFFGFSAREAEIIDPQQRVFLECAWEALEDAAYDPASYTGAIGVFAGAGMNLYGAVNLFSNPDVIASVGGYQVMVGNDKDFLCSRAAYKLNLRGPAVGVQTACSTSLVAVQMAFESLLRKECDMALAGGVSIPLPQPAGYLYVPGMILSRDGHCRAFDAAATGTVPGAGAGLVVLKPLQNAIADGDHIYAVLRGAAVNNDGSRKVGYSAPSVEGQSSAIQKSMRMAAFSPASVSYVEAHGTGTEVGDPIEIAALTAAFQSPEMQPRSCAIGAVKTNVGHLDTAAGVAGLIKTALCVERRVIPPTLHFKDANALIDFTKTPFYVNTSLEEYTKPQPFRAGVSSFGIGGTNAHVSLEEAPPRASDPSDTAQLFVLSAKSASALDTQATRLLEFLTQHPSANLADVAFTLQKGRQAFRYRRAVVAGDAAGLQRELTSAPPHPPMESPAENSGVAFLFPGQGAQYVNMARGLYDSMPVFRKVVDECCDILQPHLGRDLRTVLYPQPGQEQDAERLLTQTAVTQPALFVVEYSLAQLWMGCGIRPAAMLGHSVGEYVAACIAGVFSLPDALALIAARGRLVQSAPAGAMLAVSLSEQDLVPLIGEDLSLAAANSPQQSVASGTEAAIQNLEARLKSKGIECRRLRTSHAFHSVMMDEVIRKFEGRVSEVWLHAPTLPYLSNVSGKWITPEQATTPQYWGDHLRGTVRFADCGRNLLAASKNILLEVGPGETLQSLLRAQLPSRSDRVLCSSLRHPLAKAPDHEFWLSTAGTLWCAGVSLDWDGLHRGERRLRIPLPTYPFERQRYWIEPEKSKMQPQIETLQKQPDISDWFYLPSWKRSPRIGLSSAAKISATLLLADDDTVASTLTRELGSPVIRVRTGIQFRRISPELFEVNPADPDGYAQLIGMLQVEQFWPYRVVHAWMLNAPSNADSIEASLDRGIFSVLSLAQSLEKSNAEKPWELNVIANRIHSVFGESISSPALSALVAFCRGIALDCANTTYRVIDLDLDVNAARALQQCAMELQTPAANEVIAYRGSARWVQQQEPVRLPATTENLQASPSGIVLRERGTYLIAGGTGGIGLVLARHLAERSHALVILTARSEFPPASEWKNRLASPDTPESLRKKLAAFRAVEEAGGEVLVLQADTADLHAMREVILRVRAEYGPIHGIIHAAGIAGTGMIQTKSRDQARSVLASKVQGTEWIRECLPAKDLDFVLLCSSISAILPTLGFSDYAAANAYLGGFAAMFDDPAGTRVISVEWDTWRETGMVADADVPVELAQLHLDWMRHGILSAEANEVFDRILRSPTSQVLVSTRSFAPLLKRAWQRDTEIEVSPSDRESPSSSQGNAAFHSTAVPENEIELFIENVWRELLGVEAVGSHDDFFQLGGHSLLGTQVLARIRDRFRVDIGLRAIFEAPTPFALAQQVRAHFLAPVNGHTPATKEEREEIEI
jgi:acyl transferase domain-containing protein